MRRSFFLLFGFLLACALTACGSSLTPEAVSTPTSLPAAPSRVSPESIPQICKCVLRFDHIGIEQGLSPKFRQRYLSG